MKTSGRKVVFLDRDGTINFDTGSVYDIQDWTFLDGAIAGMRMLQSMGFDLAVVTNQAAIAAGKTSRARIEALHDHMLAELAQHGVTIAAIAYCPHGRDGGCDCRKPRTGMFARIDDQIGPIVPAGSWMVGDKESDVEFGNAIGVRTALIRSRYWNTEHLMSSPTVTVDSLLTFAGSLSDLP